MISVGNRSGNDKDSQFNHMYSCFEYVWNTCFYCVQDLRDSDNDE